LGDAKGIREKRVSLICRGSLQEQMEEESRGETGYLGLCGKLALKRTMIGNHKDSAAAAVCL